MDMKNNKISAWIGQFLANEPPRSKSLVVTIFGDTIAPHGGTVWLGSLIDLLAPFGINDRLLRTSVFRLAQEGWLAARRDGRRSAYAIAPDALARFERAYRRIYAPLISHWDGGWTLVMAGAGADTGIDAAARALLRKELLWEGFGMIAPGVAGHPACDLAVLDDIQVRAGVAGKLYVCRATALPGAGSRPLRELVGECWDLSGVIAAYDDFVAAMAPLATLLQDVPTPTPEQAFVIRTLLVHAYRRVQLHDPQLPVELLPEPWPGAQAYVLARAVYRIVQAGAEQHIMATLRREDDGAPTAEASFHQRFGGL
jgi:phenylacetic acid degradation operon negative regulatory protein